MARMYNYENNSKDNKESLKSWLERPHSTTEYQHKLISLDRRMKNIHDNGYIISHLHPEYIETDSESSGGSGRDIVFDKNVIVPFQIRNQSEQASFEEAKKQNIYSAAVIALNAYTNYSEWNLNFVKENFSNGISILFPEEVVGYYSIVLTRGSNIYLNQFIQKKSEADMLKIQAEVGAELGDGSSNSKGNSLRKSNGQSLLSDESNMYTKMHEAEVTGRAAFMTSYFLPVFLLTLASILFALLTVMIAFR